MKKNKHDAVLLSRMLEYFPDYFEWDENAITQENIKEAIKNGTKVVDEQYDDFSWFNGNKRSKEWHLGRIIYFIGNPDKIDPICIDNECDGMNILPIPTMDDGHHRYLAQIYLNYNMIQIIYGGRTDVLKYLQGKTDIMP